MDNVEKLGVLLRHWIDHNRGHVNEFENWRTLMANENQEKLATHIATAIQLMATMNAELGKALDEIGDAGATEVDEEGHHHHHVEHGHKH